MTYQARRAKPDDPDTPVFHEYLSEECYHNWHDDCGHRCSICEQPCRCVCHHRLETKKVEELERRLNTIHGEPYEAFDLKKALEKKHE